VGQKGTSNGVAFFLFTEDRRMRMEVGYGLEGALPDARAHRIDAEIIAPLLRAGDVAGALDAGTDAILAAVRGEPYKGTGRTAAERRGITLLAGERNPVLYALIPFFILGGLLFLVAIAIWATRKSRGTGPSRGSSSRVSWSSESSSSSSGSSSSSSSDFSGGGGDSGGGGSSDSY
jgi:uncharacterized protein